MFHRVEKVHAQLAPLVHIVTQLAKRVSTARPGCIRKQLGRFSVHLALPGRLLLTSVLLTAQHALPENTLPEVRRCAVHALQEHIRVTMPYRVLHVRQELTR